MPTEQTRTTYQCDLCGSIFDDPDFAVRCEKSHRIPREIGTFHWGGPGIVYPPYIEVIFDTGKTERYAHHPLHGESDEIKGERHELLGREVHK